MGVIRGTVCKCHQHLFSAICHIGELTEIFHRRVHLCHTDNVGDGTLRGDDATERVGVLLTELLEKHKAEFAQQLVLPALLDDDSETGRQVSGLLANLGALVVQTPKNSGDDLRKVRLDANA